MLSFHGRLITPFFLGAMSVRLNILICHLFVCLCWGLTSQSTIFQSCRDGATASWVINQYFRGVKCLAQGHNTAEVGLEPQTSRSGVRHSTTEPPRSPICHLSMDSWVWTMAWVRWSHTHYWTTLSFSVFGLWNARMRVWISVAQ